MSTTLDTPQKTAAMLIIGDEILSGRTKDANLGYLAEWLVDMGIELREARVIADDLTVIAETVNVLRNQYDYLFTTGGIGPTHDDLTIEAVARAFGVPLELHEAARRNMVEVHGLALNEGRLRMITWPRGAELVETRNAIAPGFQMGNVFVMAGIPKVMQAMLEGVRSRLSPSSPFRSLTLTANLPESTISVPLRELQERNPDVRIGSYPFYQDGKPGADLVIRSRDPARLEAVGQELERIIARLSA
jgi:molybdenum cofactor synthesis domain-containing protein